MPEANPLNSHGGARILRAIARTWLALVAAFYLYMCATKAPLWEVLVGAACVLVTGVCVDTLRRL